MYKVVIFHNPIPPSGRSHLTGRRCPTICLGGERREWVRLEGACHNRYTKAFPLVGMWFFSGKKFKNWESIQFPCYPGLRAGARSQTRHAIAIILFLEAPRSVFFFWWVEAPCGVGVPRGCRGRGGGSVLINSYTGRRCVSTPCLCLVTYGLLKRV